MHMKKILKFNLTDKTNNFGQQLYYIYIHIMNYYILWKYIKINFDIADFAEIFCHLIIGF